MAVRRIPIHSRSVTAKVASQRGDTTIRTESELETDFVLLMEGDPNVSRVEAQPVRIDYLDAAGTARHYTPDFLVTFSNEEPPLLVEVKYQSELDRKGAQFEDRFAGAGEFARQRGWTFEVYTEADIRGPLLRNLKFLRHYQSPGLSGRYTGSVMAQLRDLRLTTPRELLTAITPLPDRQAALLPALWHLVALRQVSVDLHEPLTMQSPIWPAEGQAVRP
jgi:TnsA endonuclease N terminal/TnsA endonuclease C terminal